jgi:hypothetical protein
MTIYFAGTEPDAFDGSFQFSTTAGYFNSSYVRGAVKIHAGAQELITKPVPNVGEASEAGWWLQYRYRLNWTAGPVGQIRLYDASNNLVLSSNSSTAAHQFTAYNTTGSASSAVAITLPGAAAPYEVSFHGYTQSGNAKVDVFISGTLVGSISVAGSNRGLSYARFTQTAETSENYQRHFSEFIIADQDTRGMRVGTYYPSANGVYTDGTGSYLDIDESGLPDANNIILANPGDKESYAMSRHGSPTLPAIIAVSANGIVASDGTNDLQAGLRIDDVDYYSSDLGAGIAPAAKCVVWNAHPGTGGYLPQNPAANMQVIYKAVAP